MGGLGPDEAAAAGLCCTEVVGVEALRDGPSASSIIGTTPITGASHSQRGRGTHQESPSAAGELPDARQRSCNQRGAPRQEASQGPRKLSKSDYQRIRRKAHKILKKG